jgi:hypothetical protein
MILNSYAVLDGFLTLLRLGLGVLVLFLSVSALRDWTRNRLHLDDASRVEDRCQLLFLAAGVLLVLNIASWPLFYLLLQSYVPEWPGVMCIYGVTRIGAGSLGPSRFLPALVTTLQALKPALVFLSGAWFVLHLINRRTRTAPLTGRVLLLLLVLGVVVVADAGTELAYLIIPKKEVFLSTGCCTEAFDTENSVFRFLPGALNDDAESSFFAIYYAVNGTMILGLICCERACRGRLPTAWLALLMLVAVVALFVNIVFLIEVAAPRLLRLPGHHCPYDLVERAPESLLSVALFFAGSFAVGWAFLAGWLGNRPDSRPLLPSIVGRLCSLGTICWMWSTLMLSMELILR